MAKHRVLAIAEAANPEWVSVPLVGWSLYTALSEVVDVHLVTHVRNREAILRTGAVEGVDVTFIDSERLAAPLWRLGEVLRAGSGKGWTTVQALNALAYPLFERLAWKRFGEAIAAGEFDIVHRITPLSPTISSALARKCRRAGTPFVIGPLNGGVPWPEGFDAERRREKEFLSYIRSAYKLLPGRRATLRNASAVMLGSRHTLSEMPERHQGKCVYLPENGVDPARFSRASRPPQTPLRACFIGRLVPYKGPDMLLAAAEPLLRSGAMTLDMIGDGPMMTDLRAQVARDGTEAAVRFHGWLQHDAVQAVASNCHVLSFPSIREFGGGVVLEAMALGLVPIVVDYAGPGELVTDATGIRLPIGPRAAIIKALRVALKSAVADPEALKPMSRAARQRVMDLFTWQQKARQVAQVYDWVRDPETPKPRFFE